MRLTRQIVLLGCTAALAAPLALYAQQPVPAAVEPQGSEGDFASRMGMQAVSRPIIQAVPVIPTYPAVMRWDLASAQQLLAFIEGIGAEGLSPADYRPGPLGAAIELGEGPELDAVASQSFTWLVEDLRDGRTPMSSRKQWFVVDPDAERLPTGLVMQQALASGDIAGELARLDPTQPDYAALKQALADTPESDKAKRQLIRANMDRWRWLAHDLGSQYLITNVPEYQLRLTVNDKIVRTYKTIVGAPGRTATPQLAETVEGVVFNPTWTVPQSIVKGEGLGNRVLNNPSWARTQGYKATRGANGFISVVQQPGPTNSLGMMKLDMPNPHAIFLHDTPSREMFSRDERALSHGCIRTERALELAMTVAILGQGASKDEVVDISTSGEYTKVPVVKSMPVYITYFTMGTDIDGRLRSFDDIYSRDAPVLASLEAPRVGNRARVSSEEVVAIEAPGA